MTAPDRAGGKLSLHADSQISLTGSASIHALARSSGAGGSVTIATAPDGSVTAEQSTVTVGSLGAGASGPLSLVTGRLSLTGGAALASTSAATGAGGSVA